MASIAATLALLALAPTGSAADGSLQGVGRAGGQRASVRTTRARWKIALRIGTILAWWPPLRFAWGRDRPVSPATFYSRCASLRPPRSCAVTAPYELERMNGYEHREARFGRVNYGETIDLPLIYANSTLCDADDAPSGGLPPGLWGGESSESFALLVEVPEIVGARQIYIYIY